MLVEALRWILLGIAVGVVFESARHVAAFRRLVDLPDWQSKATELEAENRNLAVQAALIPQLRAEIERAKVESANIIRTVAEADEQSADQPTPASHSASLEDIPSIPHDFLVRLRSAGYADATALATADSVELRERLDLMPWDVAQPEQWIADAAGLGASLPEEIARVAAPTPTDFTHLTGITPAQAAALARAFPDRAALIRADDAAILAAIDAMPWDDVPILQWRSDAQAELT